MSRIEVHPVRTRREQKAFLLFPWTIYKDDPLWIPPLLPERRKVMDPERGAFLQRGEGEFFIAWQEDSPVGTICAAVDPPTNVLREKRDCVIGFLEYIQDEEVCQALIEKAAGWALDHDLDTLYGPFHLDYENGYGVLIEGRDRPPALLCGHTPPYYPEFMERAGLTPARADNIAFAIYPDVSIQERLDRLASRSRAKGNITVRGANPTDFQAEVDRVYHLLNESLAHLSDHIGWQRNSVEAILQEFQGVADPDLVLFAEVEGRPVGWLAGVPNLNEIFKHLNGLRYPWNYLSLLVRMRQQPKCLCVKSVAVLPEYWNRGVAVILFDEMMKRGLRKGYTWADLSITSEDNPNTPQLAAHLGATIYKRYRVYKKSLK